MNIPPPKGIYGGNPFFQSSFQIQIKYEIRIKITKIPMCCLNSIVLFYIISEIIIAPTIATNKPSPKKAKSFIITALIVNALPTAKIAKPIRNCKAFLKKALQSSDSLIFLISKMVNRLYRQLLPEEEEQHYYLLLRVPTLRERRNN